MTKRDFFILIIKVFGLYSLITSLFSVLPSNITIAVMDSDTFTILWIIAALAIVFGLFIALIFKADKVVRLLKLDKGFDDDKIEIGSLKTTDIIKLGTFIIGGLLILNNIPVFLSHSFFAFKQDIYGHELDFNKQDKFNWAISGLNLIIGFLLLSNYEFVLKIFKNKK